MRTPAYSFSLITLALLTSTTAQQYTLTDSYTPSTFTSQFTFFTADDPTHGYVNYVSQSAATAQGIFSTTASSIRLGVDSSSIPPASARGRDSVRVESVKTYNAGTLIILDAKHMPVGCGTWPAFWLYGPNWPVDGEVDIIEGVNTQAQNSFAAHTNAGCSISTTSPQAFLGQLSTGNCDVNAPGQATNAGCGIVSSQGGASYGAGFNANGGGVYATQWTDSAISIWFFARGAIPSDITSGSPNPASWGLPQASFGGSACSVDQHFTDQKIVINTALCGDWAGGVWGQDATCSAQASTCQEFVQNNPGAFQDAYWDISSLKVYQSSGSAEPSSSGSAIPTPATSSSVAVSTTTVQQPSTFSTVIVTPSGPSPSTSTTTTTTTQYQPPTSILSTDSVVYTTPPSVTPFTIQTTETTSPPPAPTPPSTPPSPPPPSWSPNADGVHSWPGWNPPTGQNGGGRWGAGRAGGDGGRGWGPPRRA